MTWLALACGPLLVDEFVVPGDVAAETTLGEEGSGFGTRVATWNGEVLVTAPSRGEVTWIGHSALTLGAGSLDPWFAADGARVGWGGHGIYSVPDGTQVADLPASKAFAGDLDAHVWATDDAVIHVDGRSWSLGSVRDLALDGTRLIALSCEDGCRAVELVDDGLVELGAAGQGGRVALMDGLACFSDPQTGSDDGQGVVRCEDGLVLEGARGDHLGRALGGGYAAGGLNPFQVPLRARIVPLDGGSVLAVDRSVETRPLDLAADAVQLVIGVPGYPQSLAEAGAVHVVARDDLP